MDYTPVSRSLTFNAAVTTQMVEVPIIDDDIVEHSEIINLTLVSTDSAVVLNPSTNTITIEDVDSKLLYLCIYIKPQGQLNFIRSHHFSGHNWIQQNSLFSN